MESEKGMMSAGRGKLGLWNWMIAVNEVMARVRFEEVEMGSKVDSAAFASYVLSTSWAVSHPDVARMQLATDGHRVEEAALNRCGTRNTATGRETGEGSQYTTFWTLCLMTL